MSIYDKPKVLAFDVFGTVVDWCSGIAREAQAVLAPRGVELDWVQFANRWRRELHPAMQPVRSGARIYVTMDQLHREMLEPALAEFGISNVLSDPEKDELSLAWRRLDPWPDVRGAMARMKPHYVLAALSNANIALAVAMAKRARLSWDVILGAQLVRTYKPMPQVYDSAPEVFGVAPHDVMMVACHVWDLRAAKKRGLRTAFVARPDEYGPGAASPPPDDGEFDIVVRDFEELADGLDA